MSPSEPKITTFTGRLVNPLNLRPEDIDIRDIAHHLALCNRFAGATHFPISVALHSVCVAGLVLLFGPQVAKQALLHDAGEAYLGDVTKWLKRDPCMSGYRDAEERAHNAIMDRFGLPRELHPQITWADDVMVALEARVGFKDPEWPKSLGPEIAARYPPTPKGVQDLLETNKIKLSVPWLKAKEKFLFMWDLIEGLETGDLSRAARS